MAMRFCRAVITLSGREIAAADDARVMPPVDVGAAVKSLAIFAAADAFLPWLDFDMIEL